MSIGSLESLLSRYIYEGMHITELGKNMFLFGFTHEADAIELLRNLVCHELLDVLVEVAPTHVLL